MPPQGPTPDQLRQYDEQGYFVVRRVIDRDRAMEVRGVIKDRILRPGADASADADPMDPMGDSPDAKAARFRKLSGFCVKSPLIFFNVPANPAVLAYASHFLGKDVVLKYNSCFLKPALTGSATPWHQDNGLWRDGDSESFNFWMAIDPATRANGCLQFIPRSHREPIETHVLYEGSIHGELPRHRVEEMKARDGVEHIELEPGDMVCWHSNLYHYSPPNTSPNGRIAVAGVYSSPELAERNGQPKGYTWCLRSGERPDAFPPEVYGVKREAPAPRPYPRAEPVTA